MTKETDIAHTILVAVENQSSQTLYFCMQKEKDVDYEELKKILKAHPDFYKLELFWDKRTGKEVCRIVFIKDKPHELTPEAVGGE
jgi:hypothetical protein